MATRWQRVPQAGAGAAAVRLSEPLPGCWELDPECSRAEVSIRHALLSRVRGRLSLAGGTIQVDADAERSHVTATVDMVSLDTGDPGRDEHLRSAGYLDVEHFPLATFTSTKITALDRGHWRVDGELTIRGVARPVVLLVRQESLVEASGRQRASLVATAKLNRLDFGLTWNQVLETGGLLLGPVLEVRLVLDAYRHATAGERRPSEAASLPGAILAQS